MSGTELSGEEMLRGRPEGNVQIHIKDCKSLRVAVMIRATRVDIHTHAQRHR